jgi:hypothetical protein
MDGGWQMRNIYLYLVTFVTLMMIIFGMVAFFNSVARFIFPQEYRTYITLMDVEAEYTSAGRDVPAQSELSRLRQERMDSDVTRTRAYRVRDLVSSLAVWAVALPFYLYHWKKIKVELLANGGGVGYEA